LKKDNRKTNKAYKIYLYGELMTLKKLHLLAYKYPFLRIPLCPMIATRRYFKNNKLKYELKICENASQMLAEDPVFYVREFQGKFVVGRNSDLFKTLLIAREYEASLAELVLRYLDCNRDAIDVGANMGFYTILLAKNVNNKKVLAVEPAKKAFERLEKNLKLNQVEHKVILFEGAVSNNSGVLNLKTVNGREEYSTLGKLNHPAVRDEKYQIQEVNVTTIDSLVKKYSLDPGFMKIDVEGMEHFVLDGSRVTLETAKPIILMELSDPLLKQNGSSAGELIDFIKPFKYKILDAEMPEISPLLKPFTNILCLPEE